MEEDIKKRDRLMIFTFASLALSLVSTISYMLYTLLNRASLVNRVVSILGVIMLVAFAVVLVVAGFYIENKKAKIFISIASLLLALYSIIQIGVGIISPKDYVPDFTDYDIKEVLAWAKERDIIIEQEFAYSDKIEEFHIIKQDVEEGTPVKKVDLITVTVSNGIDPTKRTDVSDMVGWKLDDVIKFIDNNHLTNVTINFEFSNTVERDVIISQDVIKKISRNEPVTLVSSLGRESDFPSITLESVVGMDLFHAGVYLGRNNIKYRVEYQYDEKEKEGTVLKQSIKKWTIIEPTDNKEMVITVVKKTIVTVPDLSKMTKVEVSEWASKNRIKVDFREEFDDSIKEDRVISANYGKGTEIEVGTLLEVVVSKGQLKMIEFTDIDSFRKWADEKDIKFNIDYEYSTTVAKGKLIRASHSKGDIIKNSDSISLVISDGSNTEIPNLISRSKSDAEGLCKNAGITCKFTYKDGNTSYTIVTEQSMVSGSTVPAGTSITVTLGDK